MKKHLVNFAAFCMLATAGMAQKPAVVGICPFYDDTATPAGERSATMLPVLFLEKAKTAGLMPVIVNPGPILDPADMQLPLEVGRMVGADVVVAGRVQTLAVAKGEKPTAKTLRGHVLLASNAARLVLDAVVLDVASGRQLATLQTEELVKGSWVREAFDRFTILGAFHQESFWFAKTEFGKAIARSAAKLIEGIAGSLSEVKRGGAYSTVPPDRKCPVTIRVRYQAKDRASKMYLIAVNGKEESFGVNDGILNIDIPSGPLLLHITVKDPPNRQPVQSTYYANTVLDCSQSPTTLVFEIGSAGEGVIRKQ